MFRVSHAIGIQLSEERNFRDSMRRNDKGRWRIAEINVEISPEVGEEYDSQYERCHGLFEEFCIVSKSIEKGIPINVKINRR